MFTELGAGASQLSRSGPVFLGLKTGAPYLRTNVLTASECALQLVHDTEMSAKRLSHGELVVNASVAPNSRFKGRQSFAARLLVFCLSVMHRRMTWNINLC
jgi:hypothetical protein